MNLNTKYLQKFKHFQLQCDLILFKVLDILQAMNEMFHTN